MLCVCEICNHISRNISVEDKIVNRKARRSELINPCGKFGIERPGKTTIPVHIYTDYFIILSGDEEECDLRKYKKY